MHPIAFQFGSLPVRWYGVMMALGFFFGLWTATRRARRANVSPEIVADVTLWLMFGSIIGARFVYVTTYWKQEYAGRDLSAIFAVWEGGLVFYGGLIGAIVAGIIYLLWKKQPIWKIADILAPSVALGSVFGRIGCLMNGCCYGRVCNLPWAIVAPEKHVVDGVFFYPLIHPVQIYDALLNLILYLTLAWWMSRKKFDGQIFAAYLMGYAVLRSIAEHFRGDYPADHIHSGLTSAQVVSIGIFAAGAIAWALLSRKVISKQA